MSDVQGLPSIQAIKEKALFDSLKRLPHRTPAEKRFIARWTLKNNEVQDGEDGQLKAPRLHSGHAGRGAVHGRRDDQDEPGPCTDEHCGDPASR